MCFVFKRVIEKKLNYGPMNHSGSVKPVKNVFMKYTIYNFVFFNTINFGDLLSSMVFDCA
jgi:hypothetical protein